MKKITLVLSIILLSICTSINATDIFTDRCFNESFNSPSIIHAIICPTPSSGVPTTPQSYVGDNAWSWKYWLGGGNHAVFGTDSAMYIRARKTNETCDYGYIMSDSISGGISSLSFLWKQGGVESITYDIAIILNNDTIARINQPGKANYDAAVNLPDTFRLNAINTMGKFVLKIENRTIYNGTSNKGRIVIKDLVWCGYDTIKANVISGFVKDSDGNPIQNAVMSDGYSVALTSANGYYQFPRHDKSEFVFISVPAAFEIPVETDGSPQIYKRIATPGDVTLNFTLKAFADGGAADMNHVFLGISDPQVRADYETWRFKSETIKDMKKLVESYPAGTNFYGGIVGDIVWDWYDHLTDVKDACSELGFPVFQVIGNHDHDKTVCGDEKSDHYFKKAFGPTYYSFNRGKIHYVILDDIDYIGCNTKDYRHAITQNQLDWLVKDLAEVPTDKTIVFLVHAPLEGSKVAGRETLYNLINGRRTIQHIISGHHHRNTNYEISSRIFDHVLGSANGGFWAGDYCTDGTPNGYGVFEAGDKGFNSWYYKGTGFDKSFQFNAYPVNSINTGDGKTNAIIANVWNYDSKWSVNIYEDGVKKVMQQYTGFDPKIYDFFGKEADTRPNYPGSDGGTLSSQNPGPSSTNHMFSYIPSNPNANFMIEVTDRFGNVYRQNVLKNMMVASFQEENNAFVYKQDFNSLPRYGNHYLNTSKLAKGTFVQGHTPDGWYACTSGTVRPTGSNTINWQQFNYLRINNGDQDYGWLYSFGDGNTAVQGEHSENRSLGSIISSENRNIHFGVMLENNTEHVIHELEVSYTGKVWRVGGNASASQQLTFSYQENPDAMAIRDRSKWIGQAETTAIDSLSFSTPMTNTGVQQGLTNSQLNGETPRNQNKIVGKIKVNLEPGQIILLKWEDTDDSGTDHAFAIDDLVVKAVIADGSNINNTTSPEYIISNFGREMNCNFTPKNGIYLYDLTGKMVYQSAQQSRSFEIPESISAGIYIVKSQECTAKIILY